ncbi:unnamed protein product [Knipowitschia caucasica]|uniref:Ig-like domain-containing protein n=1 Tax=Knipowitschia caucasica TaxID=637954 RepID=A0AAV2IY86_KNICA
MEYWTWKQYRSIADFGSGCKDKVHFECGLEENSFEYEDVFEYQVDPGGDLTMPCPGMSSVREGMLVYWVTPQTVLNSSEYNSSKDSTQRFTVLPNGTLEIHSAQTQDSGTYACVVSRGHRLGSGKSLEVTVTIQNSSVSSPDVKHVRSGGHFNTAFTTLASCVISIVLVLFYLYLTPCWCGRNGWSCGGRAVVVCSDPRDIEAGQRRTNGKRVAFVESQVDGCNGNGMLKSPVLTPGQVVTEGILKNGSKAARLASTEASTCDE